MKDRLEGMTALVAVIDEGGFSAAARRLRRSVSAMSRLVSDLEAGLGVRLLDRNTRNVRVTDAGQRYVERARAILAAVAEAEQETRGEQAEPSGRVTVSAPLLFGRMHVAPAASLFLAQHPRVSLDLRLSDRFADLLAEGIDVAVRIGDLASSGLLAQRLGATRRVLVASPACIAASGGAPKTPADLARFEAIGLDALTPTDEWDLHGPGRGQRVRMTPRLRTTSGDVAIAHALAGGGVTAAYCYQVAEHVAAGRLCVLLPETSPPEVPIRAVVPGGRFRSAAVQAFMDHLMGASAAWPGGRG